MPVKEIEYKDADGKPHKLAYLERGSAYQLVGNKEHFAQLMAQGKGEIDAYCEAFGETYTPETRDAIKDAARRLSHNTTVVLRIQELQQPVLRKLQRKIEFNQEKALQQANVAWDLAYRNQDVKGMLAATKLQAELCKLLATQINVNHTHEALDDASTDVLLAMLKEFEVRRAKQKQLLESAITVSNADSPTPQQPLSGGAELVPS